MTERPEDFLKRHITNWIPPPHVRAARAALEELVTQKQDAMRIASDVASRCHTLEEENSKLRAEVERLQPKTDWPLTSAWQRQEP